MPDDNRFAGLSEAVDEDDGADGDGETDDREVRSEDAESSTTASGATDDSDRDSSSSTEHEFTGPGADSTADGDTETGSDGPSDSASTKPPTDKDPDDGDSRTGDSSDADDPTAFPFDATKKKTVYVRPETLEEVEDARALVDAQLRTQHDVRNLTGREFYDAALRLAAADTDGLIEAVLDARDK